MLEYDRIDLSEGFDFKKLGGSKEKRSGTSAVSEKSKECSLCHF